MNAFAPKEWKLVALRECPSPDEMTLCDNPNIASDYWRAHIATHPYYNPECECLFVLILNTKKRIKGHNLVSVGTMDTMLIHPREVFRVAIVASAHSIILMHNHPSGDPSPSEADIRATRDLIQAGKILKIDVCDHIIIGAEKRRTSLRECGFLY